MTWDQQAALSQLYSLLFTFLGLHKTGERNNYDVSPFQNIPVVVTEVTASSSAPGQMQCQDW